MDTPTASYKYRAFISYSHDDKDMAERIQRRIESYRIPRELVGKKTPLGVVPENLYPVFRDRTEAGVSSSMDAALRGALDASANLIVVCSPHAVASAPVGLEIAHFKRSGRGDRILPIIVGGEPLARLQPQDCFPKALRFKVDGNGAVTEVPDIEPLAADAREVGDREELAVLKLIAGMIGVGLGELVQRDLEQKKRDQRRWYAIAGVMLALFVFATVAAAGFKNVSDRNSQLLATVLGHSGRFVDAATRAVSERGIPLKVSASLVERAADMVKEVHESGNTSPEVMRRIADVRMVLADSYRQINELSKQAESALEALKLMESFAGENWTSIPVRRDLARAYLEVGKSAAVRGDSNAALLQYQRCLIVVAAMKEERLRSDAGMLSTIGNCHRRIAQIFKERNADQVAMGHLLASLDLAKFAFQTFKDDSRTLEDLAWSHISYAELLRQQKNFDQALEAAADGVKVLEEAGKNPNLLRVAQRLRASLHIVRGDAFMFRARNDSERQLYYGPALAEYRKSVAIRREVASEDLTNIALQTEYAFSLIKNGEILWKLKQSEAAEKEYRTAKEFIEKPIALQPDSLALQQSLGLVLSGLSDLLASNRRYDDAIKEALEGIAYNKKTQAADPLSVQRQRTLAHRYHAVARMYAENKQFEQALATNELALETFRRHAADYPTNIDYQRYVAEASEDNGVLRLKLERVQESIERLEAARALRRKVVAMMEDLRRSPLESRRYLAMSEALLARSYLAGGRCADAQASLESAQKASDAILAQNPASHEVRQLQLDLAKDVEAVAAKCAAKPESALSDRN